MWSVSGSAAARLRVLLNRVDVGLIDNQRARGDRLVGTKDVAVLLVPPDRIDRQVALQVRLLVDREHDVAALDQRVGVIAKVTTPGLGLEFFSSLATATPSPGWSV